MSTQGDLPSDDTRELARFASGHDRWRRALRGHAQLEGGGMRFRIAALVIVASLTGLAPVRATAAEETGPPDVIVVMVDDLGAIDERILERLPNIKALFLDSGLRFDAAYSETPLCCPSRASFLTGQHTRTHGVYKNRASLLDPTNTIATALQEAGYHTAMVGKYLNNVDTVDKTPPGWDQVAMLDWTRYRSIWWVNDVQTPAGYDDRYLADTALGWMQSAPTDMPLFMWLTPRAPHWGTSEKQPWLPAVEPAYATDARCDGIEPWKPPSYVVRGILPVDGFPLSDICRSLLTVDDMVGALVAAERGPTVWTFMSDNGMAWGAHGFPVKNNPWAARFPFYMAGAGVATGSTPALLSSIDVGPTLADLAGTTMPFAQGMSFAHLLDGEGQGRDWMIEDHPVGGYTGGRWRGGWTGIITPEWHFWQRPGKRPKLFHLPTDPWEMVNVRKKNRALVKEFKALIAPVVAQPFK